MSLSPAASSAASQSPALSSASNPASATAVASSSSIAASSSVALSSSSSAIASSLSSAASSAVSSASASASESASLSQSLSESISQSASLSASVASSLSLSQSVASSIAVASSSAAASSSVIPSTSAISSSASSSSIAASSSSSAAAASSSSASAASSSTITAGPSTSTLVVTITDGNGSKHLTTTGIASGSGSSTSKKGSHTNTGAIVGGVVGGVVGLALLAALLWFFCFKRRRDHDEAFDEKMFDPSRTNRHSTGDPLDLLSPAVPVMGEEGVASSNNQVDPYPYQAPQTQQANYDPYGHAPSHMPDPRDYLSQGAYGSGMDGGYGVAAGVGAGAAAAGAYGSEHYDPYNSQPPAGVAKQREAQAERERSQQYYGSGSGSAPVGQTSPSSEGRRTSGMSDEREVYQHTDAMSVPDENAEGVSSEIPPKPMTAYPSILPQPGSAARNLPAILDALSRPALLGEQSTAGLTILELASYPYEHIRAFAARWTGVQWHGSEREAEQVEAINRSEHLLEGTNLHPAIKLDVSSEEDWARLQASRIVFDGVIMLNLIQCCPPPLPGEVFRQLRERQLVKPRAFVCAYGPFLEDDGRYRSAADEAFENSHLQREGAAPDLGLRSIASVSEVAGKWGWREEARWAMPSGNSWVVWRDERSTT
ncbi:hypothetical protein P7C73_g4070, partial [Tremellales sp. Uapishka_1]